MYRCLFCHGHVRFSFPSFPSSLELSPDIDFFTRSSRSPVQWIVGASFIKNVYTAFRYNPAAIGFAELVGGSSVSAGNPSSSTTGGGTSGSNGGGSSSGAMERKGVQLGWLVGAVAVGVAAMI